MNAAHTPGKWTVQIGDPSRGAVAYWVSPSSIEEAQAHRAIIEQAPQLLAQRNELREALKQILAMATGDIREALEDETAVEDYIWRAKLRLVRGQNMTVETIARNALTNSQTI